MSSPAGGGELVLLEIQLFLDGNIIKFFRIHLDTETRDAVQR